MKAKSLKMLNWETQVKPILHKELDKYCGKDFVDALIEWTDDTAIRSIKLGYEQGKKDGEKLRKELEEKLKQANREIFSLEKELRELRK